MLVNARQTSPTRWLLLPLLATSLVLLGACGDSDDDSSGNAPESSGGRGAEAPELTGEPIKIGYISQTSVVSEVTTGVTEGLLDAWVEYTNDTGGIDGHPVELVRRLEPGNPGLALQAAEELVEEGVVAILDDDVSNDAVWVDLVEERGIPVLPGPFPSMDMLNNPQAFSVATSLLVIGPQIVESTKAAGGDKIGILYCAEAPGCAQAVGAVEAAAEADGGVEVVVASSIPSVAPNYTAQCLALQEADADALYIAGNSATSLAVAASCAQQGYAPSVIAIDGGFSQQFAEAPGMEGMIGVTSTYPWFHDDTDGAQELHDAMEEYAPGLLDDPNLNGHVMTWWANAQLLEEAIVASGVGPDAPVTAESVVAGFLALGETDLGGLTAPLTFAEGVAQPAAQVCWFQSTVQDGEWTAIDGEVEPVCAEGM